MLTWAFENLPEDLLAPGRLFPAQRVVMLAATSKRVRGLLGRLQRRVPLALQMRRRASMESVASALPGMLAWCSVVRLDMSRCGIRAEGARTLAGVLGQCSSLATLNLAGNKIDDAGMVLLRDSWLGLFLRHPGLNGPGLILRHGLNDTTLTTS